MADVVVINERNTNVSRPEPITQKQHINAAITEDKAACLRLISSARSDCLSLTDLMYKKLTRELRDMVYNYLCLEDRQVPIGPYYHFRRYEPPINDNDPSRKHQDTEKYSDDQYFQRDGDLHTVLPDGRIRTDHDIYPQDDFVMPQDHIFKSSYMGKEVALETLETYYKSNSFSVCNIQGGLDNLCTFVTLDSDGSAIDFVPIDHICNLQIRIKCEHFNQRTYFIDNDPWDRLKLFAEEEVLLRRTVESLAIFRSRIKTSTLHGLHIEIVLMSDVKDPSSLDNYCMEACITNLLQTIRNFVYELMHDCEHTTIRVTHQDDGLMAFPKDYTGLFQLTKDQWKFEKIKQQPNHDWTHDFWIIPIKSDDYPKEDLERLGGYSVTIWPSLLSGRWGITKIPRETTSTSPVVEGPYWPMGNPYNPEVAKKLIDRSRPEEIVD